MRIIIWPLFTIFIEQAICLPSLNFGFGPSSEEFVPDQFLDDLRKLVSSGGLSKNEDTMKKMLNGLVDFDLDQNPESQTMEFSDPTQELSSGKFKLPTIGQSLSNDSPPSNQAEASVVEIKSLMEWVELDRKIAKNPSLEGTILGSSETPQGDVKDDQVEPGNQVVENQSNENEIDKGSVHLENPEPLNAVKEKDPELNNANHFDPSRFASDSEINELLKNTFSFRKSWQDEQIDNPELHASSADGEMPQIKPEEDLSEAKPESQASSADWEMSQIKPEEDLSEAKPEFQASSADWGMPQIKPEDLSKEKPGFYTNVADWMTPQKDQRKDFSKEDSRSYVHSADWMTSEETTPKEDLPKAEKDEHEDDEDDDDAEENSSFTNSLMSKLNLKYWTNLNWGELFPNPFA